MPSSFLRSPLPFDVPLAPEDFQAVIQHCCFNLPQAEPPLATAWPVPRTPADNQLFFPYLREA